MHKITYPILFVLLGACNGDQKDDTGIQDDTDIQDDTGVEDTGLADADGDGWTIADGDCDDNDDTVYPGADEYCNGVDNDCNDVVDDDYALDAETWYEDADGDGFGNPDVSVTSCDQPAGYVADNTDCDDADDTVYPGADEIAGDGIDQDCDGADLPMVGHAYTQWPCSVTINEGESADTYGRVYMAGVTDATGQGPGIIGQAGYGPRGVEPSTDSGWSWVDGTFLGDVDGYSSQDSDEYIATLTPALGEWDYGWRFTTDDGRTWTYGDLGADCGGSGSDDGWTLPGTIDVVSTMVLAGYDFDDETTAPSTVASGVSVTDITASHGTIVYYGGNPSDGKAASLNGWDVDLGEAWFEFTITPDSGTAELNSLVFDDRASSTGPTEWQVLIYGDTGTWEVAGTGSTSTSFSSSPMNTVDLSTWGPFSSAFSLRISGGSASGSGGTWRIDNVEVDGAVY